MQRAGFEPAKRNGMQYEYLKYLLVAISARHPQFRHTTKPANLDSPLTTRTTLLKCVHYLMSRNKDRVPGVRHRPYISNPICIPIVDNDWCFNY